MANKKNKVKYNLKNVHYALLNIDEDGNVSYGTPVPIPGAVSIGLDANGEPSNFYADGYAYYTISNNMGYEGDLEIAMVPESFRVDVLKEKLDDNKVLIEDANVETANLHFFLSLTEISRRSVMSFTSVLRAVLPLSHRPMRMRLKLRQKLFLLRLHLLQTDMLRQRPEMIPQMLYIRAGMMRFTLHQQPMQTLLQQKPMHRQKARANP